MAFRLLNDDLFFRHPLDAIYDNDDFYWQPLSTLLTDVARRRRQASPAKNNPEHATEAGSVEDDQGKKEQTQVAATVAPTNMLSTTSLHPGRLPSPIMNADLIETERDGLLWSHRGCDWQCT